jgi:hypothetical protein
MPQYLLLLHEEVPGFSEMSPAEMQAITQRYITWAERIHQSGRLLARNKLRDAEGRTMKQENGQTLVFDGPYAESKEVVAGYFLISAASYDEAVALSRDCPHLDFGTIEIREIDAVHGEP